MEALEISAFSSLLSQTPRILWLTHLQQTGSFQVSSSLGPGREQGSSITFIAR
ncbi:MAG: hypothetical protein LBE27_06395 [Deltaproteobacteria bacterium]|nr:hypothetical protein [Deltaproteobacteria bacterium]